MEPTEARRAVAAAMAAASDAGLDVDDAVILNDSNRLVVRLTPCDTVARVTPLTHHVRVHNSSAEREVELVHRLATWGAPVAPPDPRVEPRAVVRDNFKLTSGPTSTPSRRDRSRRRTTQTASRACTRGCGRSS